MASIGSLQEDRFVWSRLSEQIKEGKKVVDTLSILSRQICYDSHNEHMNVKRKLKSICSIKEFEQLIDGVVLTDEEKTLLKMHYLNGYNLSFIADSLCYSETTIKRKHDNALKKIGNTIK